MSITREELGSLTRRPHGMDYTAYRDLCKSHKLKPIAKAAYQAMEEEDSYDDEPEDDEPEEGEPDGDGDDAQKAQTTIADLKKALNAFETVEQATTNELGRQSMLADKIAKGQASPAERAELATLLSTDGGAISKSIEQEVEEEGYSEDMDAAPVLREMAKSINGRIDSAATELRKAREQIYAQGQLNKGLAKALSSAVGLLKSLADRLDTVERQPLPSRAVSPAAGRGGHARPLGSVDARGNEPATLKKSQVARGLQVLAAAADERGDNEALAKIIHATSLFEGGQRIPPDVFNAVQHVVTQGRS